MTANDFLITNGGRLDPTWFLPHNLTTLLTAWLSAATGSDQAVEAQVYARAFETLASMIMSGNASERVGGVATSISSEHFRYWVAQAAYWRGKADALTGDGGPALVEWEGRPLWRN